jgi:hypothetical protein
MPETQGGPTTNLEDINGGPLGGDARDPGAPTTYPKDVDDGPLGGNDGGPGALTTYLQDVDGDPLRKRCQRLRSTHHVS